MKTRLLILLAIAISLFGGVAFFQAYWLSRPEGSGPAGPAVDRAVFVKVWTTRPVLLLGLGDSITAGFGATTADYSYFRRLASNPPDEWSDMRGICLKAVLPNFRAEDLARSGSTSLDHLKYQVDRLPRSDANTFGIVVMTTGGNDIIHDYGRSAPREGAMYGASLEQARPWIANYESRLDAMLRHIRANFPGGCAVFLGNIYDPADGVGLVWSAGMPAWKDGLKIVAAYNEIIARCARRYGWVHLVDLHAAFMGHG
ncbi:MAG: SGNH/GDSL hydrolase family protein, partial [Armatimonadota bacterium]|nr:SGNH/GDSL hydrolase family protein [Armatimonadota bacterium]